MEGDEIIDWIAQLYPFEADDRVAQLSILRMGPLPLLSFASRNGHDAIPDNEALEQYSGCCGFLRVTAKAGAVVDETRWTENGKATLSAICSAVDEPEGAAATLLKLVPKVSIHQNQVGFLFDEKGMSVDQHSLRGTFTSRPI